MFYARDYTMFTDRGGTPMSRRTAVAIGTVVLIGLVAFVPVLLGTTDVDEPARIRAPSPPSTPTPTPGEGTVTPTPDPAEARPADPVPDGGPDDALEDGGPPRGRAVVEDPAGDVVDTAEEPAPEPAAAVDLRRVALESDGEALGVAFTVAGPVPEGGPHSLVWSVDLHDGAGEPRYTITVQQVGARRFAGVLDWDTLEQPAPPDPPKVEGETIRVRVPLTLLADLPATFTWQALGQLDGGYEDRAPDEGPAAFPDQ
jgi:hypothetical protein